MKTWDSKSLGSRFQHGVFYWLVRYVGTGSATVLLYIVVFYYTAWPHVRRRSAPYLQRRFGQATGLAGFGHAFRLHLCFGQVLLDRIIAGILGQFRVVRQPQTMARLGQALARGRGLIVLTAHLGGWQVGITALPDLGVPVNIVHRRSPQDVDKHYFEHGRGPLLGIIDPSGPFGGLVDMAAALGRGEIVCLMGDRQSPGEGPGLAVDFLGGKVRVPSTAYQLASMSGAPIAVVFNLRQADGSITGHLAQELSPPPGLRRDSQALQALAQGFMASLERAVSDHPYQFFNFYDMWLDEHDNTGLEASP